MNALHCTSIDTPLGAMLLLADGAALRGAWFEGQRYFPLKDPRWLHRDDAPVLRRAAQQLREYFNGARRVFDLPLAPPGTPFQQAVWREIARVAHGRTITYGELARRAGRPLAVRAAGAATGRNPLTIIVPCHRIMGSDGALTGYAGGLERKQHLLALESAQPEVRAA